MDTQAEYIEFLLQGKMLRHNGKRGLTNCQKIKLLRKLQVQIYGVLKHREEISGKPVPQRWKKWYAQL